MFPINSLSGSLAQSAQVQIQQAAEKSKQARKSRDLDRNSAARDEDLEPQVENAEELTPIHDESPSSQQQRRKQHQHTGQQEESPESDEGLDLQA